LYENKYGKPSGIGEIPYRRWFVIDKPASPMGRSGEIPEPTVKVWMGEG